MTSARDMRETPLYGTNGSGHQAIIKGTHLLNMVDANLRAKLALMTAQVPEPIALPGKGHTLSMKTKQENKHEAASPYANRNKIATERLPSMDTLQMKTKMSNSFANVQSLPMEGRRVDSNKNMLLPDRIGNLMHKTNPNEIRQAIDIISKADPKDRARNTEYGNSPVVSGYTNIRNSINAKNMEATKVDQATERLTTPAVHAQNTQQWRLDLLDGITNEDIIELANYIDCCNGRSKKENDSITKDIGSMTQNMEIVNSVHLPKPPDSRKDQKLTNKFHKTFKSTEYGLESMQKIGMKDKNDTKQLTPDIERKEMSTNREKLLYTDDDIIRMAQYCDTKCKKSSIKDPINTTNGEQTKAFVESKEIYPPRPPDAKNNTKERSRSHRRVKQFGSVPDQRQDVQRNKDQQETFAKSIDIDEAKTPIKNEIIDLSYMFDAKESNCKKAEMIRNTLCDRKMNETNTLSDGTEFAGHYKPLNRPKINQQPSVSNQQPSVSNQQPSVSNQQPSVSNQTRAEHTKQQAQSAKTKNEDRMTSGRSQNHRDKKQTNAKRASSREKPSGGKTTADQNTTATKQKIYEDKKKRSDSGKVNGHCKHADKDKAVDKKNKETGRQNEKFDDKSANNGSANSTIQKNGFPRKVKTADNKKETKAALQKNETKTKGPDKDMPVEKRANEKSSSKSYQNKTAKEKQSEKKKRTAQVSSSNSRQAKGDDQKKNGDQKETERVIKTHKHVPQKTTEDGERKSPNEAEDVHDGGSGEVLEHLQDEKSPSSNHGDGPSDMLNKEPVLHKPPTNPYHKPSSHEKENDRDFRYWQKQRTEKRIREEVNDALGDFFPKNRSKNNNSIRQLNIKTEVGEATRYKHGTGVKLAAHNGKQRDGRTEGHVTGMYNSLIG